MAANSLKPQLHLLTLTTFMNNAKTATLFQEVVPIKIISSQDSLYNCPDPGRQTTGTINSHCALVKKKE